MSTIVAQRCLVLRTKPIPLNQKFFISRGRNILSKKYRETKEALALETKSQWKGAPLKAKLTVNIVLYFGDKRHRDIDAYLKILLDSMEGIVYEDDEQIVELHVFKEYSKADPRTEVGIL